MDEVVYIYHYHVHCWGEDVKDMHIDGIVRVGDPVDSYERYDLVKNEIRREFGLYRYSLVVIKSFSFLGTAPK